MLLHRTLACLALGLISACGGPRGSDSGENSTVVTAATLGPQTVRTAAEYLAEPTYADASKALGDRYLMQCRACHTLEEGGSHMLGPNLHNVIGRPAGSLPGFRYSKALREADIVWTPRAIDAWLAEPRRFLPGNQMVYAGVRQADNRAALIASLIRETSSAEGN